MSAILILLLLHTANKSSIMGTHQNGLVSNTLGIITLLVMGGAVLGLAWVQLL